MGIFKKVGFILCDNKEAATLNKKKIVYVVDHYREKSAFFTFQKNVYFKVVKYTCIHVNST